MFTNVKDAKNSFKTTLLRTDGSTDQPKIDRVANEATLSEIHFDEKKSNDFRVSSTERFYSSLNVKLTFPF